MQTYIDQVMTQANDAFQVYQFATGKEKKDFLYEIASEIEALGDVLLKTASEESNLPISRFIGESERTCRVFRMFGDLIEEGSWVEAVIDRHQKNQSSESSDLRKMLVALGPIIVFGASNFPLAYSTPGGDTASALAAGCPVVVKGHQLHPKTSKLIARAMEKAIQKCNMPPHVFQLVEGDSFEIGKLLTQHPHTSGVGFTGSLVGGRAIYDYAQKRATPIPVFAEMGSVNPVILLENALKVYGMAWAKAFADSINMGVGQFCTRPGIQLAVKSEALDYYIADLSKFMAEKKNYNMLSEGIHQNYIQKLKSALETKGIQTIFYRTGTESLSAELAVATTTGDIFLANPHLHEEVFGPFTLIMQCDNLEQLTQIWKQLKGQLSTTIIGTHEDLTTHKNMVDIARNIAGRIVFNATPTGVEVGHATVHGGPYPASTDSRFTSVGMDAIKRWARPVCFQNCPDELLPEALKADNPLNILRKVNGVYERI